jgi:hypothetical protein
MYEYNSPFTADKLHNTLHVSSKYCSSLTMAAVHGRNRQQHQKTHWLTDSWMSEHKNKVCSSYQCSALHVGSNVIKKSSFILLGHVQTDTTSPSNTGVIIA